LILVGVGEDDFGVGNEGAGGIGDGSNDGAFLRGSGEGEGEEYDYECR
jgi:hypothetical protein